VVLAQLFLEAGTVVCCEISAEKDVVMACGSGAAKGLVLL